MGKENRMTKAILIDLNGVLIKHGELNLELVEAIKKKKEKGIKVFILSNSTQEAAEEHKKNYQELFDNINKAYFSWETGYAKPNKEAWTEILKNENLMASECVYIDNLETSVEVAKGLGFKTCLYEGEVSVEKFLEKCEI